ncbi:MAG TPA: hypothetical protein VID29_04025 [Solirubrobacteraceae bacterium]|jgi:phosphoglycerol transferase
MRTPSRAPEISPGAVDREPAGGVPAAASSPRTRRLPSAPLAGAAIVAVLSTALAAWTLRLGRTQLSLPWNYAGASDTKFYLALIRGIIGHGWYQSNPSLGAPFGLQLYDFPQSADNLNILILKAIGLFSSNPALVLNVFFLLTFPLTALSAYLALRMLRVSPGAATVCATMFALLPYHFYRGESQVLLSAYYSVPLAALLFLSMWEERGIFAPSPEPDRRRVAGIPRHWPAIVLACVVIGSSGLYYAVFALLLLLGGSIVALVARRGRRVAVTGAVTALLIVATLAANLAPTLVYRAEHGMNTDIARTAIESEQFGLKLANLVLPVQQHRLGLLSGVNQRHTEATASGYCESCYENLGSVGSAGLLWLCLLALAGILGAAGVLKVRALHRSAALGVALTFGIATVGGVSALIAFFLTRDIRGWNRMSLFIAFFSLLAVALALDAARTRLATRRAGRALGGVLLAVVLLFGVLDETSPFFVPRYAKNTQVWRSDATFVKEIEARLPPGAAVFQMPYVPFPEGYGATSDGALPPSPSFGTTYELARGYIHSERLRWSYGAMKGRTADWQGQLAAKPLYVSLAAAVVDGFQGLWVDPHGYPAKSRTRLAPLFESLLGVAPLLSPARDLLFFDLRPFSRALSRRHSAAQLRALRHATLYPLRTQCSAGGLRLSNPSPVTRAATLTMRLSSSGVTSAPLLVHYPDGTVQRIPREHPALTLTRALSLPPGASAVSFTLQGPPRTPHIGVAGPIVEAPTLSESALDPFLVPAGATPARPAAGARSAEPARALATTGALRPAEPAPPLPAAGVQMLAGTLPPPCQQTVAAVGAS